jgi:hypothetical protein
MDTIARPRFRTCMGCAVLLLSLLPGTSKAQHDSAGYIPRHNLIKLGLTSSFVKTASLMYERTLSTDLSVAMTVSYMLPVTPSGLFDLDAERITFSADRKLTGIFLTPEVKWFLEKSDRRPAPRGLYLGAYLRYSDLRFTSDITGRSNAQEVDGTITSSLRIDLIEVGVGPSVGYQFLCVHDRLAIDALFFAPRLSLYTLKVKADLQGDGALAEDLGNSLEELLGRSIAPVNIDIAESGSTTIDRNSLGYRYGIKLGYAF